MQWRALENKKVDWRIGVESTRVKQKIRRQRCCWAQNVSKNSNLMHYKILSAFVFCFVVVVVIIYLELIVPLGNFSLIWRRHHCRWRAANFDLCSALMAIEQWRFFNVPHPLRHGLTLYNGHLRGPVTLTPVAERRLAVELSLPVFTTYGQDRSPIFYQHVMFQLIWLSSLHNIWL